MAFRRDGTAELDEDRDYLRQQIKKLAETLARLVLGVRSGGAVDVALTEARQAADDLLGVPAEMLDRLELASVTAMLREPNRIRAYAELCATRAALLRPAAASEAERQRQRALALYRSLDPSDPEVSQALRELELAV